MQIILDVLPDVLKLWKNVLPSMFVSCFLGNLFHTTQKIIKKEAKEDIARYIKIYCPNDVP